MKETVPAAGACVVTAFIQQRADGQRWLYVANAGDSRAILKCEFRDLITPLLTFYSRGGKAIRMTEEHKPNHPGEITRLKAVRRAAFRCNIDVCALLIPTSWALSLATTASLSA